MIKIGTKMPPELKADLDAWCELHGVKLQHVITRLAQLFMSATADERSLLLGEWTQENQLTITNLLYEQQRKAPRRRSKDVDHNAALLPKKSNRKRA